MLLSPLFPWKGTSVSSPRVYVLKWYVGGLLSITAAGIEQGLTGHVKNIKTGIKMSYEMAYRVDLLGLFFEKRRGEMLRTMSEINKKYERLPNPGAYHRIGKWEKEK